MKENNPYRPQADACRMQKQREQKSHQDEFATDLNPRDIDKQISDDGNWQDNKRDQES